MRIMIDCQSDYKPGDPPPEGYLAWHEWAEVQHAAGIKQVECGICGKWKTPQELSGEFVEAKMMRVRRNPARMETVICRSPVCTRCIEKEGK